MNVLYVLGGILGLIILVLGLRFLCHFELRYIGNKQEFDQAKGEVVSISDINNLPVGRLVFLTGSMNLGVLDEDADNNTTPSLTDKIFNIQVDNAVQLFRNVEVYQWVKQEIDADSDPDVDLQTLQDRRQRKLRRSGGGFSSSSGSKRFSSSAGTSSYGNHYYSSHVYYFFFVRFGFSFLVIIGCVKLLPLFIKLANRVTVLQPLSDWRPSIALAFTMALTLIFFALGLIWFTYVPSVGAILLGLMGVMLACSFVIVLCALCAHKKTKANSSNCDDGKISAFATQPDEERDTVNMLGDDLGGSLPKPSSNAAAYLQQMETQEEPSKPSMY